MIDSGLTNQFEYQQNVFGIYTTGAIEKNNTGLKLGLRLENTLLNTRLITTNELNNRNFNNLFLRFTSHTTQKITGLSVRLL